MKPMFDKSKDYTRAFTLLVCLAVSACQPHEKLQKQLSQNATEQLKSRDVRTIYSTAGLVLFAEAQLAEGYVQQALKTYLRATMRSQNVEVAERTAFLARQAGTPDQVIKALDRWKLIDPTSQVASEASIIFYAERQNAIALEQSLTQLLQLEPNYSAHWMAGFWAGLPKESQAQFLSILTDLAMQRANGSLAMVVAEVKNGLTPSAGTDWLDVWIDKTLPQASVVLFRARLELPNRKKAMALTKQFKHLEGDLNIQSQLARWHGLEGENAEALSLLRDIIDQDRSRHQDLLSLGLLELQAGDMRLAEKYLKELLSKEQFRSDAYYHLGRLAIIEEHFNLAINRLLRVDKSNLVIEARKLLATVALKIKSPKKAQLWFKEARLLFPSLKDELYLAEAQFQTANNMATDAVPILTDALSREPNNVQVLYTRALAYEQLGNIDSTEADLRRILKLKPNSPDALNALGYTLADQTDRYSEALHLISQALELNPESPAIIDSMGWVLLKLGRLDEAEVYLEKAWEKTQDHEIAAHYGELLWRLGRKYDARRIWDMGYESSPESDKIRSTIQRLTNL